jgi:hypothetical protein
VLRALFDDATTISLQSNCHITGRVFAEHNVEGCGMTTKNTSVWRWYGLSHAMDL